MSIMVVFHFLILTSVIPFEIVWGGRLKNHSQMLSFETISIATNLLLLAVVSIYAGIIKVKINQGIIAGAFWLMFGLFSSNTLGNLLSNNQLEKILFTPVTLLLALFSLRLAVEGKQKTAPEPQA
jgi:hypothetical protein